MIFSNHSLRLTKNKANILIIPLFLWSFILSLIKCANIFSKVVLDNPDALCLDGSPGIYHVHNGVFTNKWIVGFEGGGWCGSSEGFTQTLDNCYERSKMFRGSSISYSKLWQRQSGLLSDHPQNYYRNWSMAYLRYCTGTGHQGYKKEAVKHKDSYLYFRGHNVTMAYLDSLNNLYGLFTSATTDIIVYGQSAGGLATFLWTNFIKDKAAPSTRVISLPDSGIFLDFKSYRTEKYKFRQLFQNFMNISNEQVDPPMAECNTAHQGQLWKCMFAEYIIGYIKVPLFVIQSPYDQWCIKFILEIYCQSYSSLVYCTKSQLNYIEQYHKQNQMVVTAITGNKSTNGYWAPSCSNHVYSVQYLYSSNYRIPSGSENSLGKGIRQWEEQEPVTYEHMDKASWPINSGCAGKQNKQYQSFQEQQQSLDPKKIQQSINILLLGLMILLLASWVLYIWWSCKDKEQNQQKSKEGEFQPIQLASNNGSSQL